jgi:hypothetical protein
MPEKLIYLATEVAAFVLFHPDDLAHRAQDPVAWYSYDFAFRRESAAGRLIAFVTGADGGYSLRLTTGELTAREAAKSTASWTFPLLVRHGRVLLDNTDALPGEEQMKDPEAIKEGWFDLPDGPYGVTVHPIGWSEEPRERDQTYVDYVIRFQPVDDIRAIQVAPTMPDLRAVRGWNPLANRGAWAPVPPWPEGHRQQSTVELPALLVPEGLALLPGQSAQFRVDEDVGDRVWQMFFGEDRFREKELVVVSAFDRGAFAIVGDGPGIGQRRGESPVLSLKSSRVARIIRSGAAEPLTRVLVKDVERPDMSGHQAATGKLRSRLIERFQSDPALRARLKHPSFDVELLASLGSPEAVTTWALMHLDMPFQVRAAAYASPASERLTWLHQTLDGHVGAAFRTS